MSSCTATSSTSSSPMPNGSPMSATGPIAPRLRINIVVNWVRRRLGLTYWSLSAWAKHKVKNAVSVIGRFEEALTLEARDSGADGVICGHIHYADMHERLGIHYINTGDWVESCTAVCGKPSTACSSSSTGPKRPSPGNPAASASGAPPVVPGGQ